MFWNLSSRVCLLKKKLKFLGTAFIQNIHDSHSVHTPQYDLLRVLILVHGICNSCQNLYLSFEYNASNKDSRSRISSILQSNLDPQFSRQCNNRTVLYWLLFVDKINRKYILTFDDEPWKWATMTRLYVFLHADPFQLKKKK